MKPWVGGRNDQKAEALVLAQKYLFILICLVKQQTYFAREIQMSAIATRSVDTAAVCRGYNTSPVENLL